MKRQQIYGIDMDGLVGRRETLWQLSPEGYFIQPSLSDEAGAALFWGREAGETGYNIWRTDLDSRSTTRLTDDRAVTGHPYWSADGKRIVCFSTIGLGDCTEWEMDRQFHLNRAPRNLWLMDADGTNRQRLTEGPHVDERPCFSADGCTVVFVSDRSGAMNLWAVDVGTGALRQVTGHDGLDYRPAFSPAGDQLAYFTSHSPTGRHELAIVHWPDGKPTFPMPPEFFRWVHGPFWLPDGRTLLVHAQSVDGRIGLWSVGLDDGRVERIELPGVPVYAHGALTRDGSLMLFDSRYPLSELLPPR